MFASSENMIHSIGKRQCTEVKPWHICTFLCCTPSCTHTWRVRDIPRSLLVMWSSELPISLRLSPLPPPVTWGWEFRDCNHHLSPVVTSLVGSPLCVLTLVLLVLGEKVHWSLVLSGWTAEWFSYTRHQRPSRHNSQTVLTVSRT